MRITLFSTLLLGMAACAASKPCDDSGYLRAVDGQCYPEIQEASSANDGDTHLDSDDENGNSGGSGGGGGGSGDGSGGNGDGGGGDGGGGDGTEVCDKNSDDDGDGLIDCADTEDCCGETICSNDPACATDGEPAPPPDEDCQDEVDNNGDGLVDCDDPVCCPVPDCADNPVCN